MYGHQVMVDRMTIATWTVTLLLCGLSGIFVNEKVLYYYNSAFFRKNYSDIYVISEVMMFCDK